VVLPARSGRGGAHGPCWQGGAEDPGVLEVLSWRSWCSGVPGDGGADVVAFRAVSDI
jgi:hypothetical protein